METESLHGGHAKGDAKLATANHQVGWVCTFVAVASQAMICKGLFFSIPGSTLQYLVRNTRSDVVKVSAAFSGSEIGVFVGAATYSLVKSKIQNMKPMLSTGISLLVISFVDLYTPFVHLVVVLVFLRSIAGFMYGYSNSGLQSWYLTKWGEAGSRPFIHLHYFMYSFGALLAPLVAKPFLEMANEQENHFKSCPGVGKIYNDSSKVPQNESLRSVNPADSDPTKWSYIVIGTYTVLVSMFCFFLAACKVEDRITRHNEMKIESRLEGQLKDLWILFVFVMIYKFCCVASEMVYQEYIYAIAVCSDLKMNASEAALLNSLFWSGFVTGRLAAIIISKYIKPATIIVADFVVITGSMVTMIIWGQHSKAVAWICTTLFGFAVSTLFPSGISWSAEITNMSGKYLFVFSTGGTLGSSIMQPVAGIFFQKNPFSVIHIVAGICGANIMSFLLMKIAAWHSRIKVDRRSQAYYDRGETAVAPGNGQEMICQMCQLSTCWCESKPE